MSTPQIGLLLVNLGTPTSYQGKDVYRYLNEFLTDERVIDMPWIKRQLLVRGLIVPFRYRQSAKQYRRLWTEEGSPLLVHGKAVQKKLQDLLGPRFKVCLSMRYQNPSISSALEELKKANVREIVVFPLFPQYASATTGSVHQKAMDHVKKWQTIPQLTFVNNYADHPAFIEAFCERGKQYDLSSYDHVLFSFHGLPERQIKKADSIGCCLKTECCRVLSQRNQFCYKAQCGATARAIASGLRIEDDRYTICFQSRLGKDPWIQPYATDAIAECAKKGYKRVLAFCPSFVCDCLETTYEIAEEYDAAFKRKGGELLQLVEGLNSHPAWIKGLQTLVLENSRLA